jgi:hypothetical protein
MPATQNVLHSTRPQITHQVSGALKSAYGIAPLRLGMTREQCRTTFGDPDQVRSFNDSTFFQYLALGFDIDFELGSKARRLFFYRAGVQKHEGQCEVSVKGIGFGSSLAHVEQVLGGVASRRGHVGKKLWILFESGIQFDFDARGRVEVIVVFRP